MIQETVEKMRVLQDLLLEKFKIEEGVLQLPKLLKTKQEMLGRLKQSQVDKELRVKDLSHQINQLRITLSNTENERVELEKKISVISTQREYEFLDKEIQNIILQEQKVRKDLLRMEKELAEMQQEVEQNKKIIEEQSEELEEENIRIQSEAQEHEKRLKTIQEEEKKVAKGIDEELLFKFERIIRSKGGKGIVPIQGNVCTGCHMILPNQFVNDVRAANKMLFCPYCSKTVYFAEELAEMKFLKEESEGLIDLVNYDMEELDEQNDLEIDDELLDDSVISDSMEDDVLSENELDDKVDKVEDLDEDEEFDDEHDGENEADEFDVEEDMGEEYELEG